MVAGSLLPTLSPGSGNITQAYRNRMLADDLQTLLTPEAVEPPRSASSPGLPSRWAVAGVKPQEGPGDRVFRASGQGAQAGWGDEPLGMSPETVDWLRQHGVFENGGTGLYHDTTALVRTLNESALRGGTAALDLLLNRVPQSALHALTYGFGQAVGEMGLSDDSGESPERIQRDLESGATARESGTNLADSINVMAQFAGADMPAPARVAATPEDLSAADAIALAERENASEVVTADVTETAPEPPPGARLILDTEYPFYLLYEGRRGLIPKAKMIEQWEALNKGKKWPVDPDTGKAQIAHHIVAVADGGLDHPINIRPMTQAEHIEYHRNNGDSARWGRRRIN